MTVGQGGGGWTVVFIGVLGVWGVWGTVLPAILPIPELLPILAPNKAGDDGVELLHDDVLELESGPP